MRIRVVDLETTGLKPPAMPVEFGWCEVEDGVIDYLGSRLVNPGHPIPPECSAVHHLTDKDVVNQRGWDAVYHGVQVDAYAAHVASFERQWITDDMTNGMPWICTYKCALRLWPEAPAFSNQTLRYYRNLDVDPHKSSPPHRAGPDTYVTAHLLIDMLKTTPAETLIAWTKEPAMLPRITFGKYSGSNWSEIPEDYLRWMSRQADMDEDALWCARHEIGRREDQMPF